MDYKVYKSKRKSIKIIIKADGTLAVYCPKGCTKKFIDDFVATHYSNLKNKHNSRGDALFGTNGNTLPFLGNRYSIIYNEEKFNFDGKSFISPTHEKEAIRKLYRDFLKKEAKKIILPILKELAQEYNFSYERACIKEIYSRYGSCSSKKNLNFSIALAAFDLDFIKMVVAHELCHTIHLNHSASFYKLLEKIIPEYTKINKDNSYERSLILKSIFFSPAP